jgi:predicted MPP superfamily phosphohydrolase
MIILIILLVSEFLTFLVFRQHFLGLSKAKFYSSTIINAILSIYMWILFIEINTYNGNYDEPGHVWLLMNLTGTYCAILIPRTILDMLHFSGKLIRIKNKSHIRSLTNTGIAIWIVVFSIVVSGTVYGRLHVKTNEINIKVNGLKKDLNGLTIVQLSDMHLSSFFRDHGFLHKVIDMVNSYKPDIIINSGDFINYGWKEFDRRDTVLSLAKSRYGNFAVLGNHDIGTYNPDYSEADRDTNILRMNELITASGYKVLNDEYTVVNIGDAKLAIIGLITKGRFPHIIFGDLNKAINGLDSVDFKILIIHDPNQWEKDVRDKTDIDLTFAGHTHGMQMGIYTKRFKWSPSQYFFPHWTGLYSTGKQSLYVNRGLGVLAIPFRIWMPPEITLIKLTGE